MKCVYVGALTEQLTHATVISKLKQFDSEDKEKMSIWSAVYVT